jgi:hypothetical protein
MQKDEWLDETEAARRNYENIMDGGMKKPCGTQ